MRIKQVYEAREGSPFKSDDAQAIGEFISRCKDKSSTGILNEIKDSPEHVINQYIEWDDKIAAENSRIQSVRNIVNHIEVTVVKIDGQVKELDVSIKAFNSVSIDGKKEYVSVEEIFKNEDWKAQIMSKAKAELDNWSERYRQYQILSRHIKKIERIAADLLVN